MRQIRNYVLGLATCLLVVASASRVSAQSSTDGIAKVVAIGGDARYFVAGDSTPHALKVGMILKAGITIQTASGELNYVDVVLNNPHASAPPSPSPSAVAHFQPKAEQDGIRIFDNTVLAVDKLSRTENGADVVTDTELDLKAGSILGTVKKLSPASKYEVKIPNGVAGIRGTIYFLSASGIVRVLSGSVVVAYVGSGGNVITQVVNAGEQFDTNTGLVTPISTPTFQSLLRVAMDFRLFGAVPVTFVAPDHRIYFVSPVGGSSANSGGGGGTP
jgi:FecR-like protein